MSNKPTTPTPDESNPQPFAGSLSTAASVDNQLSHGAQASGIRQLHMLGKCMNYEHCECNGQYRFVVSDHRAVVPAIWAARQDNLFKPPPLLFRIDAHDDYTEEKIDYAAKKTEITTLDDCISFANQLNCDDGGWVEAVVKLGWVGDVVTFFVNPNHRTVHGDCIKVKDVNGDEHHIFSLGPFLDQLGSRQRLGNFAASPGDKKLHEVLHWNTAVGWDWDRTDPPPIWFDLDLDFAVHELGDFGRMPWRWRDFKAQLLRPVNKSCSKWSHRTVADLLSDALRVAKLVTIATEPEYSCGFKGISTIFDGLDRCFHKHGTWFDWNDM